MNNTAFQSGSDAAQSSPLTLDWWEPEKDEGFDQAAASAALDGLKRLYGNGIPLLRIPEQRDDLEEITMLADKIRAQSDTVVLVGIGGSSLGAEALTAIAGVGQGCQLHIMDNPDPASFADFQATLNTSTTSWLFVSKSGGTLETLSQVLSVLEWLESEIGAAGIAERCYAVTEPKDSALTKLAKHYNMPLYEHHPDLGGRWSCISNIGLTPAACTGVDVGAFRDGVNAMLQHTLSADVHVNQPLLGALYNCRQLAGGRSIRTIMPYIDRLEATASWCRQLISESLGKDGKGITPLAALGTVDQHSMLQLLLDGPDDKFFTVITTDHAGNGVRIPENLAELSGLGYLGGQAIGNVLDAFQQGTIGSLQAYRRPVQTIHLPVVDAFHLGALLMYFMLETVLIAEIIGVDAFDQPAVEDSKVRAKHVLNQG